MSAGNIKVVVRCRPMNGREKTRGATTLIRMEGDQTIITKPADPKDPNSKPDVKSFTFDKSYWSFDPTDADFASQEIVYNDLGTELLDHAFAGYNTCIFAYGQTGAGKSYSMVGYGEDKGIIPRVCAELFVRIDSNADASIHYTVEVSYMEIYCERVRDLLNPSNKNNLKVREHPALGPYVEDLSKLAVSCYNDIENLMDEGNKTRTVAATNMNATSSRSHGVFTLVVTQKRHDDETSMDTEKVSRISLVDLAGSERANSTGATGTRLKEGANINKSLTTLGKVISALADASSAGGKKKKKEEFVPYRDSVLTWLLKDSLGGNSRTCMIAAISPADYEETLSTLRYAYAAKRIQNKAVVNEDPNAKMIRELKEELANLRNKLAVFDPDEAALTSTGGGASSSAKTAADQARARAPTAVAPEAQAIREQLAQSEKIMAELNQTWEMKLDETRKIQEEREKMLEDLGIAVEKGSVGLHTPKKVPHLVNLNEDPLMSECLVYQLKPGWTKAGRIDSDAEIKLSGEKIQPLHCQFENAEGKVILHPADGSMTLLNGRLLAKPKRLHSGFRLILGDNHIFRFNHPEEVRRQRTRKQQRDRRLSVLNVNTDAANAADFPPEDEPPDSPISENSLTSEVVDWNFARKEAGLRGGDAASVIDDSRSDLSKNEFEVQLRSAREEMQQQLEQQRKEYEDRIHQLAENVADSEEVRQFKDMLEQDIRSAREEMQRELDFQRSAYEDRMRRIANGEDLSRIPLRIYTTRERHLIKWVLSKLRTRKTIQMAEVILANAVLLKEANVISRELGKQATYQYTIAEAWPYTRPRSFWESSAATVIGETADEGDVGLADALKPCVAVQVVDRKHDSAYTWSLSCLLERVERMRSIYNYIDRPMYARHFNLEDPFYDVPGPQFTFIGSSRVHLRGLMALTGQDFVVPVVCRRTGRVLGTVTCSLAPIKLTRMPVRRNSAGHLKEALPWFKRLGLNAVDLIPNKLEIGSKLLAEVSIKELRGIRERDFTQVHCQFRLSTFGGVQPGSGMDKMFATDPISGFDPSEFETEKSGEDSLIHYGYSQTVAIIITEQVIRTFKHEALIIEVYGHAQPHVLAAWEHGDTIVYQPKTKPASLKGSTPSTSGRSTPLSERRNDEELVTEERHDILSWLQIRELGPQGDYEPAILATERPHDAGVFLLKQGVQRRISLTMLHSSGRQLEWERVVRMTVGRVRLVDTRGHVSEPSNAFEAVSLNLVGGQTVEYGLDGIGTIRTEASWDSSLHDSGYLNRISPAGHRVLFTVSWWLESPKCSELLQFSSDVAVRICNRDLSRPNRGLIGLLGGGGSAGHRPQDKSSTLFQVVLTPPITKRLAELWRANTASTYVRGEEFLGGWRPKGVTLVKEYRRAAEKVRRIEEVEDVRQYLELRERVNRPIRPSQKVLDSAPQAVCERFIGLWLKYPTTIDDELVLNEDPPSMDGDMRYENGDSAMSTPPSTPKQDLDSKAAVKMNPRVLVVTRNDAVAKRGYLLFPVDPLDWRRRFFVIRRPYMFVYTNANETEEVGVINLTLVRVDHKRDLEQMLQREHVFAIYTKNNAYMLQAASRTEMDEWIRQIDPWYHVLASP